MQMLGGKNDGLNPFFIRSQLVRHFDDEAAIRVYGLNPFFIRSQLVPIAG